MISSSRFLIGQLFWTTLKSASRVIRIGEFEILRGSSAVRLASSCRSVIRVGEFGVSRSSAVIHLRVPAPA